MKAESPENPAEAVTPEEAIERRALARAQEEAREARRASLRFWTKTVCGLAAAAVVVLGAGRAADAVMHLPVFDFSTLEVEGDVARVPVERVKQAVEPVIRGNFFTEDLDEVRRAAETVPWVKRAVVRRVWPDGLRIAVETYSAFAVYETVVLSIQTACSFPPIPTSATTRPIRCPTSTVLQDRPLRSPDTTGSSPAR